MFFIYRKIFLICLVTVFTFALHAQVINIETKRFLNDSNGWVGNSDFTANITQNQAQIISLSNSTRIQYRYNFIRILLLNDYNFVKAGNTDFVNAGYQHLRFSVKLSKPLTWESFAQTQTNPVLRLDFRFLTGTGLRVRCIKTENFRWYTACLYMYEYDDIKNDPISVYEHRLSAYTTFSLSLFKHLELTSTTFYQPKIGEGSDYRIANDSSLRIEINKHLNYLCGFNYLFDSRQPTGVPNEIFSLRNGLGLRF